MTRETQSDQVVVAGAGLAGLAAAATAARAGARVLVLDEKSPGGRARSDEVDGFRFNRGPHAVYAAGAGRRVLKRLDVRPATHTPPVRGIRLQAGGVLHPALSRKVLGARAAAQLTLAFARLSLTGRADVPRISTRDWLASLDLTPKAAAMLEFFVRVSSYVADLETMPADVAIGQLRMAVRGVGYPDQGWQVLVDGLQARATEAGAELRAHTPVTGISGEPGAWVVRTLAGEEIPAAAVIVATGTPAGARRLLPAGPAGPAGSAGSAVPGWDGLGPEVTAACLDLGVRHTRTRLTFGVDEPLYLSPHAPGGQLAPTGMGMVHVARYGATSADADRARLEAFAASAGIAPGDVAASRFLPRMTVVTALPAVGTGLAGRPPVAVRETPGLFVAGDWAGPTGWLSDASLASGEQAGLLAADAVRSRAVSPGYRSRTANA